MTDRLIPTETLLKTYGVKSRRTLIEWTTREENPLPKPISGGKGRSNQYRWLRSSLIPWEITQFGKELGMD